MLDDFEKLKRSVEDLKSQQDQAKGVLSAAMARLREEYGVKSIGLARKLLRAKKRAEREIAVRFTKAKKAFEKEFGDKL